MGERRNGWNITDIIGPPDFERRCNEFINTIKGEAGKGRYRQLSVSVFNVTEVMVHSPEIWDELVNGGLDRDQVEQIRQNVALMADSADQDSAFFNEAEVVVSGNARDGGIVNEFVKVVQKFAKWYEGEENKNERDSLCEGGRLSVQRRFIFR